MIISNQNTKASLTRLSFLILVSILATFIMSFSGKTASSEETFIYEYGKASYYGHPFIGRKTASGEIFTEHLYTCAHKTLPFGTKIKVTNLINGNAIIVKVNDRGPFVRSRVVDLSIRAARELGLMQSGVANVSLEIVHARYSNLGNVKNMERIFIDDSYAYIDKNDSKKIDEVYSYVYANKPMESPDAEKPKMDSKNSIETSIISDPNTKLEESGTIPKTEVEGTKSDAIELKVENE